MKVKSNVVAAMVLIVIFGAVAATSYLGQWKTTSDRTPIRYSTGETAGQYDPADIRGSYSFGDIEAAFGIPVEELGAAFGVADPSQYAGFQVKELETIYALAAEQNKEVGTDSVRIFVALYKGLPITLTETTYMPRTAVEILKTKAILTEEQREYLDSHTVDIP